VIRGGAGAAAVRNPETQASSRYSRLSVQSSSTSVQRRGWHRASRREQGLAAILYSRRKLAMRGVRDGLITPQAGLLAHRDPWRERACLHAASSRRPRRPHTWSDIGRQWHGASQNERASRLTVAGTAPDWPRGACRGSKGRCMHPLFDRRGATRRVLAFPFHLALLCGGREPVAFVKELGAT
jgi:hypothetical protein